MGRVESIRGEEYTGAGWLRSRLSRIHLWFIELHAVVRQEWRAFRNFSDTARLRPR